MILEFLILMLMVKYRHELFSVFSKDEDEFVRRSLAPFAGLDYQPKRHLKLVVNND